MGPWAHSVLVDLLTSVYETGLYPRKKYIYIPIEIERQEGAGEGGLRKLDEVIDNEFTIFKAKKKKTV